MVPLGLGGARRMSRDMAVVPAMRRLRSQGGVLAVRRGDRWLHGPTRRGVCVAMRRGGGAVGNRQAGQSSERRQGAVVAGAMGGEGRACVAPTTGVWGGRQRADGGAGRPRIAEGTRGPFKATCV